MSLIPNLILDSKNLIKVLEIFTFYHFKSNEFGRPGLRGYEHLDRFLKTIFCTRGANSALAQTFYKIHGQNRRSTNELNIPYSLE